MYVQYVQYILTSLHATSERGGLGPAYVDEFSVCTLSWHRFPVLYRYLAVIPVSLITVLTLIQYVCICPFGACLQLGHCIMRICKYSVTPGQLLIYIYASYQPRMRIWVAPHAWVRTLHHASFTFFRINFLVVMYEGRWNRYCTYFT